MLSRLAKTQPARLVVSTSFVNSSCSEEVFLLTPQSAPEKTVDARLTLHELRPIEPLFVQFALVFALKSSEKTVVWAKDGFDARKKIAWIRKAKKKMDELPEEGPPE